MASNPIDKLYGKTTGQRLMSILGRSSEKERQEQVEKVQKELDLNNIELNRLRSDIKKQLYYYQSGLKKGGTRKRRTKRIKRTRLR